MEDKKVVSLDEFRKARDAAELAEERVAIQSEQFYKPPAPKKLSIGGMRPASLGQKLMMALLVTTPYPPSEEELALFQLWIAHLYLPTETACEKVSV